MGEGGGVLDNSCDAPDGDAGPHISANLDGFARYVCVWGGGGGGGSFHYKWGKCVLHIFQS